MKFSLATVQHRKMAGSSGAETLASSSYVGLSKNPLRFEPVSRENSVFFDEANKQVFSVRQVQGYTRVVVKGPDNQKITRFDIADKGHVASIKFSLDHKILAVQRTAKAVDFMNFIQGSEGKEYQQTCKSKSAQIIGFNWTGTNEIVFNTNQGLELYQVFPEKNSLKLIKNYSVQVNWFVYLADITLLLFSSTAMGNVIHPYSIRTGSVIRLPKFEVELSPVTPQKPKPTPLLERDVTISVLYGEVYVIILRTQQRGNKTIRGERTTGAEVVLYQLMSDRPARKSFVLQLNTSGRFAVNTVDNLIIVHHQASKTSMVFDIKMKGISDGQVTFLEPILAPLSIESFTLYEDSRGNPEDRTVINCEMYSANWIVFQPNIIIDAKLGCLWGVYMKLNPLLNMIADKAMLIAFLLLRRNSKANIIDVCKQALMPRSLCPLAMISKVFDKLNLAYQEHLETEANSAQTDQSKRTPPQNKTRSRRVVDQEDMYRDVFSPVLAHQNTNAKFVVSVLIEYIRSLNELQIKVEYCIHELLINILVHNKRYYQLHQLLQYHVITDSKHLACVMLSLEKHYPPAYQLALDMLKRLNKANEEIVEILLSKGQLLSALRFLRSIAREDSASPRKFLDAALNSGDSTLFYTVFKFFEQRNQRLRGHPMFVPGEHCEQFVEVFKTKFGDGIHKIPVKT